MGGGSSSFLDEIWMNVACIVELEDEFTRDGFVNIGDVI